MERASSSGGGGGKSVRNNEDLGKQIVEHYNEKGEFVELRYVNVHFELVCKICHTANQMTRAFEKHFQSICHTKRMEVARPLLMKPNALVWPFDDGNEFFHGAQNEAGQPVEDGENHYGFKNLTFVGRGEIGTLNRMYLLKGTRVYCAWLGDVNGQNLDIHKYGILTFSFYPSLGISHSDDNRTEGVCAICSQPIYTGKDCSTLLHMERQELLCSSGGDKPWFCTFHTSCLIYWLLILECKKEEPFCPKCLYADWGIKESRVKRQTFQKGVKNGRTMWFPSEELRNLEGNVIGLHFWKSLDINFTRSISFFRGSEDREDLERRRIELDGQQSGDAHEYEKGGEADDSEDED